MVDKATLNRLKFSKKGCEEFCREWAVICDIIRGVGTAKTFEEIKESEGFTPENWKATCKFLKPYCRKKKTAKVVRHNSHSVRLVNKERIKKK